MTHHMQNNALDQIGELLAEHGFDGMPRRSPSCSTRS